MKPIWRDRRGEALKRAAPDGPRHTRVPDKVFEI